MARISIAGLLGFVAVFAIGLAALVKASSVWAGFVFTLTIGFGFGGVLGIILRGWRRGGWLGFVLFGWGYYLIGNISVLGLEENAWLLPDAASEWIFSTSNSPPVLLGKIYGVTGQPTPEGSAFLTVQAVYFERSRAATMIGRWLWVLLFAEVGSVLGVLLGRGRTTSEVAPAPTVRPVADGPSTAVPDVP
jgi:hypothetical protein